MFCFETLNVTDAFTQICEVFNDYLDHPVHSRHGDILETKNSRNGPVLKFTVPVCVSYKEPTRRTLINPTRDANPFFHIFESLWMLAGRNDLAPLKYFVSNFDNYSDDGETLNGAYGYRWRHAHIRPGPQEVGDEIGGYDQIEILIKHLKEQPNTRRAVLQMWDVRNDLLKIDTSKDVCCNLSALFQVRYKEGINEKWLDMTVFNRSNDAIWGLTGANAVHFSVLQEYIALAIDAIPGMYYQITNDLHTYLDKYKGKIWLKDKTSPKLYYPGMEEVNDLYPDSKSRVLFDKDVKYLFEQDGYKRVHDLVYMKDEVATPFIAKVVIPMLLVYGHWKLGNKQLTYSNMMDIQNSDWRHAVEQWLLKRINK